MTHTTDSSGITDLRIDESPPSPTLPLTHISLILSASDAALSALSHTALAPQSSELHLQ